MNIEDHGCLVDWLQNAGWIRRDEKPRVETLAGGVSNRTVLVQRSDGDAWVIKQGLEKLRVQTDWFCDPARVHREAAGLRWLQRLLPPGSVPRFVGEDDESHLLMMQAVPQPHANWKTQLLSGQIDPESCRQFGQMLGMIHARAAEQRSEIGDAFDDRSYFEALRLEPYYAFTATNVPDASEFLSELLSQTRCHRLTLVHGDFSPKNILVHAGRLVLLDHEVIHWGDPAFDVGFGLTHLLSKSHHLPQYRTEFATAAGTVWHSYHEQIRDQPWRAELQPRAVRHLLGCLLARVAGRSPLEYLTDSQRDVQRRVAVELINDVPATVDQTIELFVEKV